MMCVKTLFGTAAVLVAMTGMSSSQEDIVETYQGAERPQHWGNLPPEFGACQNVGAQLTAPLRE